MEAWRLCLDQKMYFVIEKNLHKCQYRFESKNRRYQDVRHLQNTRTYINELSSLWADGFIKRTLQFTNPYYVILLFFQRHL